ncbi:hypothetical protein [Proteiniphilum sp.]|uniref:hypothetical protein n=1 Tax=Proteiniphilum sp. TaxID=1926877 RepID=UPI00332667D9
MKNVNLSPECVSALQDMQRNYDTYVGMLECACDYIIDSADTLSEEFKPGEAMASLKQLRDLKNVIAMFAGKGGEA